MAGAGRSRVGLSPVSIKAGDVSTAAAGGDRSPAVLKIDRMSPAMKGVALALLVCACGPGNRETTAPEPPAAEPKPAAPADFSLGGAGEPTPIEAAPPVETVPEPRIVRITVVSGEIASHMKNGEHWDVPGRPTPADGDVPLGRYLRQHPELTETRDTVGIPVHAEKLAEQVEQSPAADPMVFVEVGDRIFRSPLRMRALNPVWDFGFELLHGEGGAGDDTIVHIRVVDFDAADAHETIGSTTLTLGELLAERVHRLDGFGSVEALTLQVDTRPVPEAPEPEIHRLAVPGHPSWTHTPVEVSAGQRIRIEAADEVCTKGDELRYCKGPEGLGRDSTYNLPGFRTLGHGMLVGAIGDVRFPVGRSLELIAPSSGPLWLGVNDRDSKNNRGNFAVRVLVEPVPR